MISNNSEINLQSSNVLLGKDSKDASTCRGGKMMQCIHDTSYDGWKFRTVLFRMIGINNKQSV